MPIKTTEFSIPMSSAGTTLAPGTTFTSTVTNFFTEVPAAGDTITFISARIEIYAHQQFGANADMTSYTIGFGWGTPNPVGDFSTEATTVNLVGLKQGTMLFSRDLTAWFTNAYAVSGLSSINQFGYTFSHAGTNTSLVNLCAKVTVTYKVTEFNGLPTTRSNLVRIPLDSNTDGFPMTTTQAFKAMGSGQIPGMTAFLPEGGKSIISMWVELEGNDQSNNTANYQIAARIDAIPGSTQTFSTITKSLNTANWMKLHYHIPASQWAAGGTLNIGASCSIGTKTALIHMSAVLHVLYLYQPASTSKMLISVMGMTGLKSGMSFQNINTDIEFNIQESSPVLRQSGAVANWHCSTNSAKPFRTRVGAQAFYAWTSAGSASVSMSGQEQCSWRFDAGAVNGAGLSIARGLLKIPIEFYQTGQSQSTDTTQRPDMVSFRVYLTYECDAPSIDNFIGSGPYFFEKMNRTIYRSLDSTNVQSQYTATTLVALTDPEDRNFTNISMDWRAMALGEFATVKMSVARMAAELGGQNLLDGGVSWAQWQAVNPGSSKSFDLAVCSFRQSIQQYFRSFSGAGAVNGLDWQYVDRRFLVAHMKDITPMSDACVWETSTGIYASFNGIIINAGENLLGQVVDIFDQNDKHLMETFSAANGQFSYYAFDDTLQYYAVARRNQKAGASLLS